MKNIKNHLRTINEWRNCPMANFVCPVAIETGLETNTPRGKMFLLSLLDNCAMDLDETAVKRLYECCLCGLCTQCGFDDTDIPAAMAAARADICEAGLLPERIKEFGKEVLNSSIWCEAGKAESLIPVQASDLAVLITWGGQDAEKFKQLTETAGLCSCIINEGEYDTALLYEAGLFYESKAATDMILRLAEDERIASVVIGSPHLWSILKARGANEIFLSIPEFVAKLIAEGRIAPNLHKVSGITYHDPCRLVRNQVEDVVRAVLKAAGLSLNEAKPRWKDAKCCGGPILKLINPNVSNAITQSRIAQLYKSGAEKVLVACSHCHENFKNNCLEKEIITFLDLICASISQ